ncbi:MAG TPA: LLM class flavin-dependent oxidoreductase [Hyphomicrobiaceae bacterium]|nr:LLM class flavin-dependent oxidoreductase [Hyphomicrobiaceae bacterium]
MAFELGMFEEFWRRKGQTEAGAFRDGFAQIEAGERYGLDVCWLAELHVNPSRSVAAAPLNLASAIAARTQRMKIGIAVQVLPLCHPLRLAEEVATVDHVSGGRLIFGVGRSGFARTYEAYGVPYAESRERFTEVLDILRTAFTEERFSYEGKFHRFRDVHLVPKPLQKPYPEIRIAATSYETYPAIGAEGYPILIAVRQGMIEELGPHIRAYREAYRANRHPGQPRIYLRVPVYVGETPEAARREPEHSIMPFYRELGAQIAKTATMAGVSASENRGARAEALLNVTYEETLAQKVIVGSPDEVADRINELKATLGIDGILAEMNCGGLIPHERVMNSIRLMCEVVGPRVR